MNDFSIKHYARCKTDRDTILATEQRGEIRTVRKKQGMGALMFFMKSTAIVLLALGTTIQSCGQSPRHDNDETKEFIELVKSRPYFSGRQNSKPESLVLPIIHKDRDFEIQLADRGLSLEEKQVVLKNPHSDSEYPLSFANPSTLPKLKDLKKLKREGWAKSNIGYADNSNNSKKEFEYYGILSFSSFKREGELLYWIHWNDFNFLATIDNNIISVVDPLFIKDKIYTHDPVTTTYDNGVVLMNFDFYGLGREREVSLILVDKNTITRVDWSENY